METSDEVEYNNFECNACDVDILQYGEFSSRDTSGNNKGHLRGQLPLWRSTLPAPEFVQSMIEAGYRLPFLPYHPRCYLSSSLSAYQHADFVVKQAYQSSIVCSSSHRCGRQKIALGNGSPTRELIYIYKQIHI